MFSSLYFINLGNKIDVRKDEKLVNKYKSENINFLKTEDGEIMAKRIGAYAFRECSSKTREGVREVFECAARASLLDKSSKKKSKHLKRCFIL